MLLELSRDRQSSFSTHNGQPENGPARLADRLVVHPDLTERSAQRGAKVGQSSLWQIFHIRVQRLKNKPCESDRPDIGEVVERDLPAAAWCRDLKRREVTARSFVHSLGPPFLVELTPAIRAVDPLEVDAGIDELGVVSHYRRYFIGIRYKPREALARHFRCF
jgi:hypothetical protein